MTITRKARFELWPQGATAPKSQHNDEREALESALDLGPGKHEIRLGETTLYLEVVNPDVGLQRVDIDGVPHIKIGSISVTVNGKEQQLVCPIEWEEGPVELRFAGRLIGRL